MLDSFINFFTTYVSYWPLATTIILLFAGINIPISEDAMIIISAGIAVTDHSLIIPNWIGLFLGIYLSDIISYYMGRLLSNGAMQIRAVRKRLTPARVRLIAKKLDDYGFRTFLVCRFIPFGVRNTLFMGSGFVHLPLKKFVLYDFGASVISLTTMYTLVFFLGQKANMSIKIAGIAFFLALVGVAIYFVVRAIKSDDEISKDSIDTEVLEQPLKTRKDKKN